jgi:hypothetical protein
VLTHAVAAAGVDAGQSFVEIERIHAWGRRDRAWWLCDVESAVEALRLQEPLGVGVFVHVAETTPTMVTTGGLEVRRYFRRYTDDGLDLCDALGSYVPGAKVKLDEISKILGLSGNLKH